MISFSVSLLATSFTAFAIVLTSLAISISLKSMSFATSAALKYSEMKSANESFVRLRTVNVVNAFATMFAALTFSTISKSNFSFAYLTASLFVASNTNSSNASKSLTISSLDKLFVEK